MLDPSWPQAGLVYVGGQGGGAGGLTAQCSVWEPVGGCPEQRGSTQA